MRIQGRLERRWRVTRKSSDRPNFTRQCHRVSELLYSSRSQYYSELVKENKRHDQREVFGTAYKLLHLILIRNTCLIKSVKNLPTISALFNYKIAFIRLELHQRGLPADEFFSDLPLLEVHHNGYIVLHHSHTCKRVVFSQPHSRTATLIEPRYCQPSNS